MPSFATHELQEPATVPRLLASASARFGDDDYVISPNGRLSFRQADEQSAQLARQLVAAGVGKGTRVGIVLPSGTEFAVAFLAVGRVGAIAMLFSSTYRPAELERVLRIGDVDTLLAPSVLLGRDYARALEETAAGLAEHGAPPLRLPALPYLRSIWLVGGSDRPWATSLESNTWLPEVDASLLEAIENEVVPADTLLSICTSGSSADPKLVLHTHGAVVRKVHPSTGIGLAGSWYDERVFVAMPFFWVGGPLCLLGALHTGSALVCQERFDPDEAIALIERERVTTIAGWRARIDALRDDALASGRDVSALRALVPMLRSSRDDPVNVGMTETCGPHHNPELFEYRVVDPETEATLADGETGEFWVRGYGSMQAMYKREREDTFDADGWYRTGDRGYLEGGRVFFVGRYSEMLKTAGANVSPAEVEQALLTFPEVAEAYVMGVPHPDLGDEVVAVLVPTSGAKISTDDLSGRAKHVLSAYKVPKRFLVLDADAVPRLATGKADKRSMVSLVVEA